MLLNFSYIFEVLITIFTFNACLFMVFHIWQLCKICLSQLSQYNSWWSYCNWFCWLFFDNLFTLASSSGVIGEYCLTGDCPTGSRQLQQGQGEGGRSPISSGLIVCLVFSPVWHSRHFTTYMFLLWLKENKKIKH